MQLYQGFSIDLTLSFNDIYYTCCVHMKSLLEKYLCIDFRARACEYFF